VIINKVIKYLVLVIFVVLFGSLSGQSFRQQQLKYGRVKTAYRKHWIDLKKEINQLKIDTNNFFVYLRAFKQEGQLEVWLRSKKEKTYTLFKVFPICNSSGELGPKKREGDGQVPEGFYTVSSFNPSSSYHLSLKVSYPNKADVNLNKPPLGGDIMIHGKCVTIGCIPIEDDPIEQVYTLCVEAQTNGNPISIDIFPFKFTDKNKLSENFKNKDQALINFWNNLFTCGNFFEKEKQLKTIKVNEKGAYHFD